MDTSFEQTPSTNDHRRWDKLRADTPGPKSYTQSLAARPTTTSAGSKSAFMHSGFPRRPLLPPLPDTSPARTPTRKVPRTVTTPIPASPAPSQGTYNTTPGYIAPGQTSARAYPKFTPGEMEMPEVTVADLAMAIAAKYPRGKAAPAFYRRGVKVPPSLVVRGGWKPGRDGAGAGGEGEQSTREGSARQVAEEIVRVSAP